MENRSKWGFVKDKLLKKKVPKVVMEEENPLNEESPKKISRYEQKPKMCNKSI